MICTWVDCEEPAAVLKTGDNGEQWANLCKTHAEFFEKAEDDFLAGRISPGLFVSDWIKAQGGSKKVAERMVNDVMR